MCPATGTAGPNRTHVVGISHTAFLAEQDAILDELVFQVVSGALQEAALRKHEVGLSVLASMDVLDGRSISSGLTTAASGGYLSDAYRLEADLGVAISAAASAIAAGDVEVAIAVGVYNPEIHEVDAVGREAFGQQVSNLAFDFAFNRPVAMTAHAAYGMHAAHVLGAEGGPTLDELAGLCADEITTGAKQARAFRREEVKAADVLASPPVAGPLRQLMLSAHSTGAVAVVLASGARAARCRGRNAVLRGSGQATASYSWEQDWFTSPQSTTARAAAAAYGRAGVSDPADSIAVVEVTAPSPALHVPYLEALGLAELKSGCVNRSGGVRSNYPGLVNGGLRLLEVVEALEALDAGSVGIAHSVDTITGPVSEDVSVLVVEGV